MKLVCESCGSVNDATAIRVDGGRVVMTCGACGAESGVVAPGFGEQPDAPSGPEQPDASATAQEHPDAEAEPELEPDAAVEPELESAPETDTEAEPPADEGSPPVKCPRCFHRQHATDFCHRCGLDLALPVDPSAWDEIPEDAQEMHARAVEMWVRLEQAPDDANQHEAFLAHCTTHRLLTWAIRRYRDYLADHPGAQHMTSYRDQAVRKLETVALTILQSDRWSQDVARKAALARTILLIIAILLLIGGLVLVVVVFKETGSLAPTSF